MVIHALGWALIANNVKDVLGWEKRVWRLLGKYCRGPGLYNEVSILLVFRELINGVVL
jgi:hypothetical protein